MSDALDNILAYKRKEITALKAARSTVAWEALARAAPVPRPFVSAVMAGTQAEPAFICEFKRQSPSGGAIRPGAHPGEIASAYAGAGAACLSVLTDSPAFGGSLRDMQDARKAVWLPTLRKDFTLDPVQVLEARAHGADAVLLILAALSQADADALEALILDLGMAALLEVHDGEELARANSMRSPLIGINNRNLKTLQTDIETTLRLAPAVRRDACLISESGIRTRADVERLAAGGAHAFLVGESLMRAPDPALALSMLRGTSGG
jgi:indole-3-glycerol phosphate synthase